MAVTIKDVAKQAGVSHSTVSRALHNHPSVARETIARIKKIAVDLGYIPSAAARSLKTSRTRVLGVIVNRVSDPFYSEVLDGIHEVLQAEGYSLFLASSNHDAVREKAIVQAMAERRVDGVILCSTYVGEQHTTQLSEFSAPVVVVHNRAFEDNAHSIYHDDRLGSRQMTRHLIELGHERIAFLGNARGGRVNEERLTGFRDEMGASELPVPDMYVVQAPNGGLEGGAAGVQPLLSLPNQPTAIVCYNDMMAIGAIQSLRQAGRQVPQDCSVTGFDDISLSAFVNPPLTTFDQPKYQLGCEAAQMMLRVLRSAANSEPDSQPDIVTLRGEILVRSSTAPPPG